MHKKDETTQESTTDSGLQGQSSDQVGKATGVSQSDGTKPEPDAPVCKEELELLKEKNELIEKLQQEIAEAKDQYMRKLADYENFRKRMFRERDEAVSYANNQLLVDLVEVLDNFDRAIQSAEVSKDFTTLHDGIVMIQKHFLSLLEGKYGLKRFDSLNEEFDPHRHEAMLSEQGDCEHPLVSEEYSKGYMLKDRVLRTARVKVTMPASGSNSAAGTQAEGQPGTGTAGGAGSDN
mgnify:FL=1